MTDSDSDCDNVFGFRNDSRSTVVQATVTGPNFKSTMNMNFNNASVAGSMIAGNCDDHLRFREHGRSAFGRREMSPMSVRSSHSVFDMQPPRLQQSLRHRGFAQSSMVNGYPRAVSPESVRSIGSNVTATDIITAFKSKPKFNEYEMRNLKEAYNKFIKSRARKRIEKRRNLKLFMKGARRRSSYDSGDQASNSSISSDDCRSTKTGFIQNNNYSHYMESVKKYARSGRTSDDAQSNITDIRKTIQDSSLYRDCSKNLRQDSFRNTFILGSKNMKSTAMNRTQNTTINRTTQQERFKSSFLLPSQRFTKSSTVMPIAEEGSENKYPEKKHIFPSSRFKKVSHTNIHTNSKSTESEEQDDNMFIQPREPHKINMEQPETQKKRNLNHSDYSPCSENKKTKISSPVKNSQETETREVQVQAKKPVNRPMNNKKPNNDFVFVKPCMPMRKSGNPKTHEKVTPQNTQPSKPVSENNPPLFLGSELNSNVKQTKEVTINDEHSETLQSCASDVSARPSFIKRKLFTQTLDVTESRNINRDSSSSSISPQTNVYSAIAKEKTKARKLVTSQSCLSRDVNNEDNNLLDLIHKIVPPECMNATAQKSEVGRKSEDAVENSNRLTQESRWDITSLISECNDGEISDTYTDEEIFVVHSENRTKKRPVSNKIVKDCGIVIEREKSTKVVEEKKKKSTKVVEEKKSNKANKPETPVKDMNKNVYSFAHAFWNCDSESEEQETPKNRHVIKENSVDKCLSQFQQDPNGKKRSLLVKNIKSVLENTKTSNESSQSIEDIGHNIEKLENNKNLRIKAAKALRDNKSNRTKPTKPTDLKKSLCNLLNESKTQKKSTERQLVKKTANKQYLQEANIKQSGTENKHPGTEQVKQKRNGVIDKIKPKNKTNNNNNAASHQPNNKIKVTSVTKDLTVAESNGTTVVNEPNNKIRTTVAKTQLNRLLENSNNTDLSDISLNTTKRGRGRPSKVLQDTDLPGNSLNTTKRGRGRPRQMVNTDLSENNSNTTKRVSSRPRKMLHADLSEYSLNMTTRRRSKQNTTNSPALIANKKNSNNIPKKDFKTPDKKLNARGRVLVTPRNVKKKSDMKTKLNVKTVTTTNAAPSLANVKSPKRVTQAVQSTSQGSKKCQTKISARDTSKVPQKNEVKRTFPTKIGSSKAPITRSSKEKSFVANINDPIPKQNIAHTNKDLKYNLKSKNNVTTSIETKTINKHRKHMDASNKENVEVDSSLRKSSRSRTIKSKVNCRDEKHDDNKGKPNTIPDTTLQAKNNETSKQFVLPIVPLRDIRAPVSPCIVNSRPLRVTTEHNANESIREVSKLLAGWGLGGATIGVVPRHCATEGAHNATYIDDDCKSVTVRSVASSSLMTRSRRPKFLHVY